MAMNSFQLFLSQIKSNPEALRIKMLQIIFDILMSYDEELLGENGGIVSPNVWLNLAVT